jgi:hypothetical protein
MSLKAKDNHNSYAIGYGRPPQHSRFKKGQSGNPTGRRRYTESERGRQLLLQDRSAAAPFLMRSRMRPMTSAAPPQRSQLTREQSPWPEFG